MNLNQSFKKEERLCSRATIKKLFEERASSFCYPLKFILTETNLNSKFALQVLITVPKKNFKKSVTRNKIKRRIKEAYRKNKWTVCETLGKNNKQFAAMFLYTAKEETNYKVIEMAVVSLLKKISQ